VNPEVQVAYAISISDNVDVAIGIDTFCKVDAMIRTWNAAIVEFTNPCSTVDETSVTFTAATVAGDIIDNMRV